MPLPATLIDAHGIVVDVNQAFVDYARRLGVAITKQERVGQPVLAFAASEQDRERLRELLAEAGRRGTLIRRHQRFVTPAGRVIYNDLFVRALSSEQGGRGGLLILRQDVTEEVRQERRQRVVGRIREQVWRMKRAGDVEQVLVAMRDGLCELEVPFANCGVNVVDESCQRPVIRSHNMTQGRVWLDTPLAVPGAERIRRFWREGRICYRRDLDADDPYGEREALRQLFGQPIRAVADIPFLCGTLAINSTLPEAFSRAHLAILEEWAHLLSEGFARVQDLESLERRNQQLMLEVAERERAEAALRAAEHEYRTALNAMSDWVQVADTDLRILFANESLLGTLRELGLPPPASGQPLAAAFPFLPERVLGEYAQVLAASYHAIKKADPEATVLGCALAGPHGQARRGPWEFVEEVLKRGGSQVMDGISVHPYRQPSTPEDSDYLGDLKAIGDLTAKYGKRLPIWISEVGWPNNTGGSSEAWATKMLPRAYLLAMTAGVRNVAWYDYHDDGQDPSYLEHNCGLLLYDLTPKAPYFAFRTLATFSSDAWTPSACSSERLERGSNGSSRKYPSI